ncbi:hypothetical protein RFI_04066 [Reticulomyxa filosa]|uniref:Protein kinase domain-containing protein n=1 Tax=Reticulomyxa filosa TaxID=46433 RepID=X6P5Z3_RETFI|nr:hypothetical protein RFI_04066 [Reticulomyxa filosa]|eukprot:ETO33037.1 hypothetical protein RFI_04066 [Reticulomyxa filosa]
MAQAQVNRSLGSNDTRPASKSNQMEFGRAQTDRGPGTTKTVEVGSRTSKENLLDDIDDVDNTDALLKKVEKEIKLPANELTERDFFKKYWIEAGKIGELSVSCKFLFFYFLKFLLLLHNKKHNVTYRGAFSKIRKISRKSDKQVFALKMIKKKGKSKSDIRALQKEIYVLQSVYRVKICLFVTCVRMLIQQIIGHKPMTNLDIYVKCNHPNIVQLLDWCDTKKRIYMVVEYCDGGDVFERVVNMKKFSELDAAHVVQQVASGLEHLHQHKFVHRDLKPDNVMYLTKAHDSSVKIIDLGLAGDCNDGPCTTPCGTAHYAAPEVLGNHAYGVEADIWSLGVITYTLLCGFPPFFDPNNNMKNLYHLIKKAKYAFPSPFWDEVSDDAKDFIKKCLIKDTKERLTAAQVLAHPWVAGKANIKGDFSDKYLEQMKKWQSTRHQTELHVGERPKTDDFDDADDAAN